MILIADNLALVGKPVDEDDFIDIILNGLGPAYEATINSVNAREKSLNLEDLKGLLLGAEKCMEAHNALPIEQNLSALYVSKNNTSFRGKQNGAQHQISFSKGNHFSKSQTEHFQHNAKNASSLLNFARPKCQIYGFSNHIAINYYHQMDRSYDG